MTRVKISVGILCLLIGIGAVSGVWLNGRCRRLDGMIDGISQSISADRMTAAVDQAKQLRRELEKFRDTASMFVNRDKLSEIDRISSRIERLAANGSDELESELTELKSMIKRLKEGEMPSFSSIF